MTIFDTQIIGRMQNIPAIERATVILFITSKASIASKNCLEELEYAELLGKKIIPIAAERVDAVPDTLKEKVRRDSRNPENFHDELLKLIQRHNEQTRNLYKSIQLAFRAARWRTDQLGLLDSGEINKRKIGLSGLKLIKSGTTSH